MRVLSARLDDSVCCGWSPVGGWNFALAAEAARNGADRPLYRLTDQPINRSTINGSTLSLWCPITSHTNRTFAHKKTGSGNVLPDPVLKCKGSSSAALRP
jgi:hypothetical protein